MYTLKYLHLRFKYLAKEQSYGRAGGGSPAGPEPEPEPEPGAGREGSGLWDRRAPSDGDPVGRPSSTWLFAQPVVPGAVRAAAGAAVRRRQEFRGCQM